MTPQVPHYLFYNFQELAEALDLATEAIELRPETYEGFYARAKTHMELGNQTEALNDAKAALEKSSMAPIEIKKVLMRLQEEIGHRIQTNAHKMVAESMDTITDL